MINDPLKEIISMIFSIAAYKQEMRRSLSQRNRKWKKTVYRNKHIWLKTHTWIRKSFMGTFVNWTLPSLHGGPLRITLTVPSVLCDLLKIQGYVKIDFGF